MIVSLKNIGTLHEASFDLDKDFIVFIGTNNTGKTYASYCLYGLNGANNWRQEGLPEDVYANILPDIKDLFLNGSVKLNLREILTASNLNLILAAINKRNRANLPYLFDLDEQYFENSTFDIQHNHLFDYNKEAEQYSLLRYGYPINELSLSFLKNEHDDHYTSVVVQLKEFKSVLSKGDLENRIKHHILLQIFGRLTFVNDVAIIPAERIGISVFAKDIFKSRFTRTNEILKESKLGGETNLNLMLKEFNTYSAIIQDSLEKYSDLTRTHTSFFATKSIAQLASELESKILKGTISTNSDGDVFFITEENKELKLQASGSIIKSLAMLVLYLKYSAKVGQILIIDEPEINLHPDNQRLVARILAKLSKLGVKVIVSTHSDYFIRELNNLIMLNKDHPETIALREKYGYEETEVLDHTRVGAYLFKNHTATAIEVTEAGMEAATIDEEINKLNNTQNDIYWTLFED